MKELAQPAVPSASRARGRRLRTLVLGSLAALLALGQLRAQEEEQPAPGLREFTVEDGFISISVSENGIELRDFITLCQQITGKVLTWSPTELQSASTTIHWAGTPRIRRENFFAFFQTMLYIRSFAVVPRGSEDTEIYEIVNMQGPRRAEISSSAKYVETEDIEQYKDQTGVTILTVVPLEHINAANATTATRPFFSQAASTNALLTGNLGDNRAMLLQGFAPQVYAAYQLLRLADVPPAVPEHETRIFPLEYATAEEIEPTLTRLLEGRQRQLQQAQGASGGVITAGPAEEVQVLAHGALNALLISGPPQRVIETLDLIAKLDRPVEYGGGDIHVVQLRNVLAEDLEEVLRNFLREDLQAERQQQAGTQTQSRQPRQTVIVAHPASNSMIISATQSKFTQIRRMIEQLDHRQPQVLIEAALVELTTGDIDRLGVELGLLDIAEDDFTRPFAFTSGGLSAFTDTDDNGIPDTRLPDFENPLQGLTGGIITGGDFSIPLLVHALQSDDRANILSLPSVVVNNNETATVNSKENRPTLESTQGTATTTTGVGQPREAGIELRISPSISTNEYLRLNVTLTVSRFLGQADPTTGGITIERSVETQVTLPSGHTMVLGGIIEDSESESESGVPYLKDIPILGALFRTKETTKNKTNLYFFVTPTILHEDDFSDLIEISQRRKLEAADYIGHRRLRIVDRRWLDGRLPALDDPTSTVDDLDRQGAFDVPNYVSPTTPPDREALRDAMPTGPDSPFPPIRDLPPGEPIRSPGTTNGSSDGQR